MMLLIHPPRIMPKPLVGYPAIHIGSEADPLPQWREALASATPEAMVKLLVDISAWAHQHPKSTAASTLLGDTYLKISQPYAAERSYRQAIAIEPKNSSAREGLGLALLQSKQPAKAVQQLAIAQEIDPSNVDILVHLALALIQTGHLKAAHNRLVMATALDSTHPQAWLNLGVVDARRGAWANAIAHLERALSFKQDFSEALHNLVLAHRQVGNLSEAVKASTKLTQLPGVTASDWCLHAELLLNSGQWDTCKTALGRALELQPDNPDIYVTQANLYSAQRDYAAAEGVLSTALAVSRDDPSIQLELGFLHLLQSRFETGWPLHEARKSITSSPVRQFPIPEWQGEDISNKCILIHAEQGLGDTIMFAHCLPDIIRTAGHVVIEVATRLEQLFATSFPTATVVGRNPQDPTNKWLYQLPTPPSCQIAIGSLPYFFRKTPSTFLPHNGYLTTQPESVEYWGKKIPPSTLPRIGIAWQGGLIQTGRIQRSISVNDLAPHLASIPAQWISLQYGDVEPDLITLRKSVVIHHFPEALADQYQAASLTCALDAVVCVCSTQAHLTGALGKPGLILVPFNANWRYGASGTSSPWYPSLHLLRQSAPDDWSTPISHLRTSLRELDQ